MSMSIAINQRARLIAAALVTALTTALLVAVPAASTVVTASASAAATTPDVCLDGIDEQTQSARVVDCQQAFTDTMWCLYEFDRQAASDGSTTHTYQIGVCPTDPHQRDTSDLCGYALKYPGRPDHYWKDECPKAALIPVTMSWKSVPKVMSPGQRGRVVVAVHDNKGRPVNGMEVHFLVSNVGTGADWPSQGRSDIVITQDGLAVFRFAATDHRMRASAHYATDGERKYQTEGQMLTYIEVKPVVTAQKVRTGSGISIRGTAALSGKIGPDDPALPLRLQRRAPSGWATVASTLTRTGTVTFRTTRPGTYRVFAPRALARLASASASVQIG